MSRIDLIVAYCFALSFIDNLLTAEIKFKAQKWKRLKRVGIGSSFTIICQTNDSAADVSLNWGKKPDVLQNINTLPRFNGRVKKVGQNFTIASVKVSDSGRYQCEASNAAGMNIKLYKGSVMVQHTLGKILPYIRSKDLDILVETNGSKNITCETKSDKSRRYDEVLKWTYRPTQTAFWKDVNENVVHWIETQGSISDSKKVFKAVLILTNFQEENSGIYRCTRVESATFSEIKIKRKPDVFPTVLLHPKDTQYPITGSNITLKCKFDGSPFPTAVWSKTDMEPVTCDKSPCYLNLTDLYDPKHSGSYECSAKNLKGTATSKVTLDVRVPPRVKDLSRKVLVFKPGEEIEISIDVLEGNPKPTIVWDKKFKCKKEDECAQSHLLWNRVVKQYPAPNKQTYKSYMVTQKNMENMTYRYTVKNGYGSHTFVFNVVRQEKGQSQFEIEPQIQKTVVEEKPLTIVCRTDINIYGSAKFTHDGEEIGGTTRYEGDIRVLTITIQSMTLKDGGKYKCEALSNNAADTREKELQVDVKALYAPLIKNSFIDATVNQSDTNTVITCEFDSLPLPEILWSFDNKTLETPKIEDVSKCKQSRAGWYQLKEASHVLVICHMKFPTHDGYYGCNATNKRGSSKKVMKLTILAKPSLPKLSTPSTITLLDGDSFVINCSVLSNPPANVTWYKVNGYSNNTELESISSNIGGNSLHIKWEMKTSADKYLCIASNFLGMTEGVPLTITFTEKAASGFEENWKIIVGVLATSVVILFISVVLCLLYRHYLKKSYAKYLEPNKNYQIDPDRSLFEQSIDLPYDVAWEFPRKRLNFVVLLGSGEFGEVWLAHAEGIYSFKPRDKSNKALRKRKYIQNTKVNSSCKCSCKKHPDEKKPQVAVKTLKSDATENEYKDLASELKILIHLGEHSNIVNLLGACTKEGKLHVLLEYCPHGNLLNFLRARRDMFQERWTKLDQDMANEFTLVDLMVIVCQVAKGMDFLQSKRCVHRDLATRNILVGEDYVMKIADFGLARDIYKEDVYLKKTTSLVPVKWMAPEALFDKMHTSMSDVWSYGVLLWEVFTLGGSPYPSVPVEDLFKYLKAGRRMERPDFCPPALYSIMLNCWERSPSGRPMFHDITRRLRDIIEQNFPANNSYVNLNFGNDQTTNHRHIVTPAPESPTSSTNRMLPLKTFKDDAQGGSKEPLLYGNVPITPTSNCYVKMTAPDHYQTPNPSMYKVPHKVDKDGTYV